MTDTGTLSGTHSVTWKKSTIQSVLADYDAAANRKITPAKRKPKKQKRFTFDDENETERQKARRERNLQRYEDVQRMRDLHYKVKLDQLRAKVELQRELIRKQTEESQKKIVAQQEQMKLSKKKPQRHTLEHDEEFVRNVPKSDYYKIVALQEKLQAGGMLKNQEERDKFWTEVKDPNLLRRYLFVYKPLPFEDPSTDSRQRLSTYNSHSDQNTTHRSRTSSMTIHKSQEPETNTDSSEATVLADVRPLTRIQESRESSRPVTRENTVHSGKGKKEIDRKILDPSTIARQAAAELDKKFPAMELPPMSCLTLELGEKALDSQEILKQLKSERRRKLRLLTMKRIQRMYNLSLSNWASAQRILSHHEDDSEEVDLRNPSLKDIIAIDELTSEAYEALSPSPPSSPQTRRPWSHHLERCRSIMPIEEEPSRTISAQSPLSQMSSASSSKHHGEKLEPLEPVPLSLGNMEHKVIKAKCMSSLWTNYLQAGKSKFAPLES